MKERKSVIPNIITVLRIVGTASLLLFTPLSLPFYLIYTLSGLTDVLDGAIARATGSTSELGAKLDSAADLVYYSVMLLKIMPILIRKLPLGVWCIVAVAIALRLTAYIVAAVKFKRFASRHSILNKITGFMVFAVPYIIGLPFGPNLCYGVAGVAALSSGEEMVTYFRSREYPAGKKAQA